MPNAPCRREGATARRAFLPFSPPFLGEEEIAEVIATLRSEWITTGPRTKRFEESFADAVGAPSALALNSCTAGLHVALVVAGVGAGDEVIVPTLTFCASANVAEHVGARVVLVDVEPETLTVDPKRVEAAITPRTRAVVAVHYAGHPAALDDLRTLCAAHGILLLEDAAHAFPASYKGRRIGSGTNPVAFSFYATKNLSTAEGGMLTGDAGMIERARIIALHGMDRDAWKRFAKGGNWQYDVVLPGFKYNMTDIASALGLRQLERIGQMQRRRREVVAKYQDAFGPDAAFEVPVELPDVESAWHLYVLRIRPEALTIGRDQFIVELTARNIGTSVHYTPVHMHSYYRDKYRLSPDDLPVARDAFHRMVTLPLHPGLSDDDVDDVIGAVLDVRRTFSR